MNTRAFVALFLGLTLQVGCGDDDHADFTRNGDGTGSTSVILDNSNGTNGGPRIVGNGQRVDESRSVSGFVRVSSSSALDVEVKQDAAFSVTVSIDANLLAQVTTELQGDTLVITTKGSFETKLAGPQIRVTLPHLVAANSQGAGDLSVATVETEELSLGTSGSGDVQFEGSAPKLVIHTSGSGDASLQGAAPDLAIRTSGSGDVDATKLTATTASVSSSGSGDVAVTATGTVSTNLSGSGDVDIHGGAAVLAGTRSGSGQVRHD
ncbi:MAG: hypothetical protein RLZZ450_3707 [Pseudomonadota bacterium]|jgi:hypothetical protein